MAESRRKFDEDFKVGAVRIVRETGGPLRLTSLRFAGGLPSSVSAGLVGLAYCSRCRQWACMRRAVRWSWWA